MSLLFVTLTWAPRTGAIEAPICPRHGNNGADIAPDTRPRVSKGSEQDASHILEIMVE
jgi:hypothetical protein